MATTLTIEHVAAIMPNARSNGLDKEWNDFVTTLNEYDINNKNRIAAFLMNVAGESGELYYVSEIADGWDYEGRTDLGNTQAGDGPRYKGHGYIQTTGRGNHRRVGEALGIDAEGNPTILTEMPWAWYSAGWYWKYGSAWGDLNSYADNGNMRATIIGVRGSEEPNREHYWWDALAALPDDVVLPQNNDGNTDEEPTLWIYSDINAGWSREWYTGKYIRAMEAGNSYATNSNGWLYQKGVPAPVQEFSWPIANDPVGYLGDGSYVDYHPTRYYWRSDIDAVARYLVQNYNCTVNTYVDHPPSWGLDDTSLDIWGPGGRGDHIDNGNGDAGFWDIFNNGQEPWVRWCIQMGLIWDDYYLWRDFWEWDIWSDGPHYRHRHITFY